MIKILYFARLRDTLNCGEEQLEYSAAIDTGEKLLRSLKNRGAPWQDALDNTQLLMSVNQTMASPDTSIQDSDEVAFFPPVTGG